MPSISAISPTASPTTARSSAKWQKVGGFSRGDVKGMQDQLVAEGYDVGKVDGLVGFKTRIAVGLWQAKQGQAPTCFPDAQAGQEHPLTRQPAGACCRGLHWRNVML